MRRFLLAILALLPLLFLLPLLHADDDEAEAEGDVKEQKVELPPFFLAETKGQVHLVFWDAKKKQAVKEKAKAPRAVAMNDRVVTGKKSYAYLQFKDGGTVEVGPQSDVFVQDLDVSPKTLKARFLLAAGLFRASVKKLVGARSSFEVEAGGVVAGVRGTTFEVEYDPEEKQATAKTYDGQIFTLTGGKERIVKKGFSLAFSSGGTAVSSALGADDIADFVEFINVTGDLEKKKKILLKQLEKQILKQLTGGLIEKGAEEGTKSIRFGF